MPKSKQEITDHEKEISFCQAEIDKHNQQIRELQTTINYLVSSLESRANNLQDLETQLSRARLADETAQEQAKMYLGTDIEQMTIDDAIRSSSRIRQLEKQIDETRQHNAEQNAQDATKRAELEQQIERLFLHRDQLKNVLAKVERERDEAHYNEGKKIYQDRMVGYQKKKQEAEEIEALREKTYQAIETYQFDTLKQLDGYPELQKLFMQEHNVEVSDASIRVSMAAVGYLETLIADHLELQGVVTSEGQSLAEILSLTDMEILADFQGGLYNLQDKRSQLLDFIEARKAMLQEHS
jgi:chromosome segregation ATPase